MPLITTIIPTYRRPRLLKAAIQSVLKQTFSDFQIWVYDNASGDETRALVEEMALRDRRIKYVCQAHQVPAAENFWTGISSVASPFFSILADDDLLAPHFFETAIGEISRFPRARFFLGSTLDISEKGRVISANALKWEEGRIYEPPLGLYEAIKNYYNWTGALFRKEILEKVQLDLNVKPIDADFVMRLAAQFPFVISQKPCALFIHRKESYSSRSGHKLVWPSWPQMMENIASVETLSPQAKTVAKNLMLAQLQKILFSIVVELAYQGEFGRSKAALQVLLDQFPRCRWGKLMSFYIPYGEKSPLLRWIFRKILNYYRSIKRSKIQIKYGRLVRSYFSD